MSRVNRFGESYCNTAADVRARIEEGDEGWAVHATAFEEPEGDIGATCEVRNNGDGELVCYVEAPTLAEVRAIVEELKLEVVQ